MNMYRLLKAKILRREDIPVIRLRRLASELNPLQAQELVRGKLLVPGDIAGARFSTSELEQPDRRKQIEMELVTKDWEVTVSNILSSGVCGFIAHPSLSEDAFINFDRVDNPNGKTIQVGNMLCVRLQTKFDKKKSRWGFAVKSGKIMPGKVNY